MLHVDLDLAVDLNQAHWPFVAAEGRPDAEQDVPVIVQVHDDVQVHLQNGILADYGVIGAG
jgi:hypothetical protein